MQIRSTCSSHFPRNATKLKRKTMYTCTSKFYNYHWTRRQNFFCEQKKCNEYPSQIYKRSESKIRRYILTCTRVNFDMFFPLDLGVAFRNGIVLVVPSSSKYCIHHCGVLNLINLRFKYSISIALRESGIPFPCHSNYRLHIHERL